MHYYTVLLADDESGALNYLKNLINWEAYGFHIVGYVQNGIQALSILDKISVDILITDVVMPVMNGIQLAAHIQNIFLKTKVIFISSYDDPKYLHDAIILNSSDYILKNELTAEKLTQKLLKIAYEIEIIKEESLFAFKHALSDLFNYKTPLSQHLHLKKTSRLYLEKQYTCLIVDHPEIIPVMLPYKTSIDSQNDPYLHHLEIEALLSAINFESHQCICAFHISNDRYLALFDGFNRVSTLTRNDEFQKLAHHLQENLYTGFHQLFHIALLKSNAKVTDLYESYIENKDFLTRRHFSSSKSIINMELEHNNVLSHMHSIDTSPLRDAIEENNAELIEKEFQSIFSELISLHDYNQCSQAIQKIINLILYYSDNLQSLTCGNYFEFSTPTDMQYWMSIENTVEWLKKKILEIIQIRKENATAKYPPELINMIIMIQQNYANRDFSIEYMMDTLNINRSRVSTLFRQNFNMSPIEFLTNYRIEQAKKMILNGKLKVYEIANKTGYSSSQYFCKVFKNIVGVSPYEYKMNPSGEKQ